MSVIQREGEAACTKHDAFFSGAATSTKHFICMRARKKYGFDQKVRKPPRRDHGQRHRVSLNRRPNKGERACVLETPGEKDCWVQLGRKAVAVQHRVPDARECAAQHRRCALGRRPPAGASNICMSGATGWPDGAPGLPSCDQVKRSSTQGMTPPSACPPQRPTGPGL
jgi:hypothetical protein